MFFAFCTNYVDLIKVEVVDLTCFLSINESFMTLVAQFILLYVFVLTNDHILSHLTIPMVVNTNYGCIASNNIASNNIVLHLLHNTSLWLYCKQFRHTLHYYDSVSVPQRYIAGTRII